MTIGVALALVATGARPGCSLPPGWSAVAASRPRFIVFGEEHGSREPPELVGSIACALAAKGERILVAVELPSSTDPQLQRLWQSPAGEFADRIIADLPGFALRKDGVGSDAMLEMLDRLHALSKFGKSIDVVAFDRARDAAQAQRWHGLPGQASREAEQAENIATAAAAKAYDKVLVLTGNGHARKLLEDRADVPYEPMAMRLARSGPLLSLRQTFGTGTEWNCVRKPAPDASKLQTQPQLDCGAHGQIRVIPARPTQVGLWSATDAEADAAYDGYFWFPVVHASRPAGSRSR